MRDDFVVLILSHGRANDLVTVKALENAKYDGKWYIVIDDEDSQEELYYQNFGRDRVIKFCKEEAMRKTEDAMDNFRVRGVPVYARNMLHGIAKDLGYKYFMEIEDDMLNFRYRWVRDNALRTCAIPDINPFIDEFIKFLDLSGALTVAFAEGGDLLGGYQRVFWRNKLNRKAMMCYFCRTDNPFQFTGTFNDDVNMYLSLGKVGHLIFTVAPATVSPKPTQQSSGGITDVYKKYGTYVKSFYSVMLCPDCVKVREMPSTWWRVHHAVCWENAVPKIISGRYKKK